MDKNTLSLFTNLPITDADAIINKAAEAVSNPEFIEIVADLLRAFGVDNQDTNKMKGIAAVVHMAMQAGHRQGYTKATEELTVTPPVDEVTNPANPANPTGGTHGA